MKVVITGGGTGGHLFPGLAIADELLRQDPAVQILYIGAQRGVDQQVLADRPFPVKLIRVRGLTRRFSPAVVIDAWCLFTALLAARRIIRSFQPDIAIGTGGYVSAPVIWASRRAGVPCLLQEQNSFPGLATRWLARYADRIHLNFREAADYLKVSPDRIRHTGNPTAVKADQRPDKAQAAQKFGLEPGVPTLLILGGSQGARSINRALLKALPRFTADLQVLWQCGRIDAGRIRQSLPPVKPKVIVTEFIDDMASAYTAAVLAVCRSGAMTLTELALFGVPSILVPLPIATGDHQRRNAEAVAAAGAARVIRDQDLRGDHLAALVNSLIADTAERTRMSQASRKLARPDAARQIVDSINELVNQKRTGKASAPRK